MKRIWSRTVFILTLHCDQATHLASESLDRPLAFYERAALRMHTLICWSCRHFSHQMRFMRNVCQNAKFKPEADGLLHTIQLDDKVKNKLRSQLSSDEE